MTAIIENKVKHCRKCDKKTKHQRGNNKSSGFMILIHLILIVVTAGIWLAIILIWKILNYKIGGWSCAECGK